MVRVTKPIKTPSVILTRIVCASIPCLRQNFQYLSQYYLFLSSPSRSLSLCTFKPCPRLVFQLLHHFFLWTSQNSAHKQHLTMLLSNNRIIVHNDSICLFHIILPPSFIKCNLLGFWFQRLQTWLQNSKSHF